MTDGTRPGLGSNAARAARAEEAFRRRLEELGATLLEPRYGGSQWRHHVRDAAGHDCYPTPHNVAAGHGICKICADEARVTIEADFLGRLAELGCTPLYETYEGQDRPHRVRCSAGHDCAPMPASIKRGQGACKICARKDRATAEAAFRARIIELGGTLLGEYQGVRAPVLAICPAGHECHPRPNIIQQGGGMCRWCTGRDPARGEAKFLARLCELGATPAYDMWRGTRSPTAVVCAAGHACNPYPQGVIRGGGACPICAGLEHTVFYVLEHDAQPLVKFGISSQDGRARLATHRWQGYTKPHLLVADLPPGVARTTENAVKSALALAGERPVRGCEYFDVSCLGLILDVASSWVLPIAV